MKKILIAIAAFLLPLTAFAVQISVPAAPGAGYGLVSTTTGTYIASTTNKLIAGSNVTFTGGTPYVFGPAAITISASGGSGTFPFTPFTGYNATSTAIGFLNGLFSTASSTFVVAPIFSSLTGVLKGNGASALTVAANGTDFTLIAAKDCTGTGHLLSVTAAGVFTCSADTGSGGTSAFEIATTSDIGISQVAYISKTSGRTTLASAATTTHSFSGPFTITGTIGALVGGTNSTVTYTGISTTTALNAGQVVYSTGGAGVSGVATTSATCTGSVSCGTFNVFGSSPVTITSSAITAVTGTSPIVVTGGTAISYTGLATTTSLSSSNLLVSNGLSGVYSVATSAPAFNGGLTTSGTAGAWVGGSGYTVSLASVNANSLLGCAGSVSCTPTSVATTSLFSGTTGQTAYFSGTNTLIGTSTIFTSTGSAVGIGLTTPGSKLEIQGTSTVSTGAAFIAWDSASRNLFQIRNDGFISSASSTPWAQFSVNPVATNGSAPSFVVGSSTGTNLVVSNNGRVGVGTTSPLSTFSVVGDEWHKSTNVHYGNSLCGFPNTVINSTGFEVCGNDNTIGGSNLIIGNSNAGTSAFADLLLENDRADSTGTHYAVVNFNSSTYSDTTFGTAVAVPNLLNIVNSDGPITWITSTTTAGKNYQSFVVGGQALSNEVARFNLNGLGIGTTTPQWPLTLSSSTKPQLTLTDGSLTSPPFNFRAIGTHLYVSSSSAATYATTTLPILDINSAGTGWSFGSTTYSTTDTFIVTGSSAGSATAGTCFRAKDVGVNTYTYWWYKAGVQTVQTTSCSGTGTTTITYE